MKEKEIITCLKEKNEKAAEMLLRKYGPLIRYIVTPFLKDEQEISTCIDDIVWKVCENIAAFDPEKGSWNAWITTISRNTALNQSRRNRGVIDSSVSLDAEDSADVPSQEPTPEEALLKKEKKQILAQAIQRLTPQERNIFYRKYYYQQSNLKIASELGLSERSVEGRLYRIRKKLREMLGGEFYDG